MSRFEAFVNRIEGKSFTNKSTSRCDFRREIFYRILSAIKSNVDFIVNSIVLYIHVEFRNKHFIDAYWQLIATFILLSINTYMFRTDA